MISSRISFNKK